MSEPAPASVRLTSEERRMLDELAGAVGCARSELLRAALALAADADPAELRALVASMPAASRRQRNAAMAAMRGTDGATWATIAAHFGVSTSGARYGVLAHRAEAAGEAVEPPRRRLRAVS